MCSENTSPRISFSNDLNPADVVPVDRDNEPRRDSTLLDYMNSDFEFNIASSSVPESSLADVIFANGVILPFQIQERNVVSSSKQVQKSSPPLPPTASLPPLPRASANENPKKDFYSLKEIMVVKNDSEEKPQSKSFWGFKRSNSLNCDAKKSLSSLPFLSRSNSTGSASNKRISWNDFQKHCSQKLLQGSSNTSSSSNPYTKKKNYGGSYANGVKNRHVLNVPPPYISKGTANLFGLGSFLRSKGSKDKKNKK